MYNLISNRISHLTASIILSAKLICFQELMYLEDRLSVKFILFLTHIVSRDSATRPQESQSQGLNFKIGSKFDHDSTSYEFNRKFNFQVLQLLKAGISFINEMTLAINYLFLLCNTRYDLPSSTAKIPHINEWGSSVSMLCTFKHLLKEKTISRWI